MRALRDFLLAPASDAPARARGRRSTAAASAASIGPASAAAAFDAAASAMPAACATTAASAMPAACSTAAASAMPAARSTAAASALPAADATPSSAAPSTAAAAAGAVAVLCAAEDARALGVALAGLLARRARASCALVCVWTSADARPRSDARPPASRAARRLAGALTGRGHDALASGRAAVVALPADPDEALTAAARAAAAAGAAPTVLVLGGPRPATFDEVLAAQDRLLVVSRPAADTGLTALALAGLPADGPPCHACTVALGTLGRAAAAAGLATPAALRRALDVVDGDGS